MPRRQQVLPMQSKARLFGHQIHPMLVVFPIGLFVSAIVFDIIYFGTGNPRFAFVAYWNIVGGLIGGLLAAVFGLVDFLSIPRNTRSEEHTSELQSPI